MIGSLINWLKTLRDEKGAEPVITLAVEDVGDPRGLIDYFVVIRTDITITDFSITYSVNTSIPNHGKDETRVTREAVIPSDPFKEHALRLKVIPADEVRRKEAEIKIPVAVGYSLKTGERRGIKWSADLSFGSDKFTINRK